MNCSMDQFRRQLSAFSNTVNFVKFVLQRIMQHRGTSVPRSPFWNDRDTFSFMLDAVDFVSALAEGIRRAIFLRTRLEISRC